MTFSRSARAAVTTTLFATAALLLGSNDAFSQKGKDEKPKKAAKAPPSTVTAEDLLKVPARPARPALQPSELPLKFIKGERIAFVGNALAERLGQFGHFEAALHYRHPDLHLVIRNFGRPADEVSIRQRSSDYTKLDDPLYAFGADTFFCFFGFNESFAGPSGVEKFKADYERFLDDYTAKYPRDDAKSLPRFVLVSPIAPQQDNELHIPMKNIASTSENIKLYTNAVRQVAAGRKLAFIDLFTPTTAGTPHVVAAFITTNGVHINKYGDQIVSMQLDKAIHGGMDPFSDTERYEKIRKAVVDKSWVHNQDHHMLNGWYVYGGRRTFDTETFPREYVKIRNMAAVRDQYIWDIASGKPVPETPDDSMTGELIVPPTKFGQGNRSEGPELKYLSPDDLIRSCKMPEGFELKVFADEKQFPELAKPVQMMFDNKGRLWVSTMPSYPQWKPGDPKPADKLIILEDIDGDGKADKCTVFYDKLHCPTGFEFYNGGVIVVDQPRLLFLKDTDGDDKADQVTELNSGWASDDTHHTIGAFEWSHGGYLQMLEGVSMSTAVETPGGPFRNHGSSGAYSFDPRSQKVTHYNTPGYGNPWCYVYNDWGQGIVGDGTGAKQHWDTLLSGPQFSGRKSVDATIDPAGMRPVVGSDFLRTRQFPDEVQNQFIFACVINMNGLTRFDFKEDGSGYTGKRTTDLLASSHKHFRPVDVQVGPDGALWFGDWANALIGHMQYSQRDPNRDHSLGRIYRMVYTKKPLLKPVTQFGKSVPELFDQLREYENRTRYRARRELWARPQAEVVAAAKTWNHGAMDLTVEERDKYDCEVLWVLQGHRVVDVELLTKVLHCKTPNARAAAVKIVADERELIPTAKDLLIAACADESSRVQIEAVRGLGWFRGADCTDAVLAIAKKPMDKWLKHVVTCTLGATEGSWTTRYLAKQIGQDSKEVGAILGDILKSSKVGTEAAPWLATLLGTEAKSKEERNKAMSALASMKGGAAARGKAVFRNGGCVACHKIAGEGADYGPELSIVGSKHNKFKLIESIIDPNAEIDEKYLTTKIVTLDGKTITGLMVSETKEAITIFDGKEKKTVKTEDLDGKPVKLKQSSMPEGLAGTISPAEFLDLVEFLASLKDPAKK